MVYSLIDLNLPSLSIGLRKTCIVFLVACVILRIILKFRFSQYSCLCELDGFLLRRLHIVSYYTYVLYTVIHYKLYVTTDI